MTHVNSFAASPLRADQDKTALIVASRRWFREGLKGLLQVSDISVTFDAATLDTGLEALAVGDCPAIAIVNLEGDDSQVLRDLATISRWRPRLSQAKWVVLCPALKPSYLLAALRSGVSGLFHVDISEDVLRRALELVMVGQVLFPAELAHLLPEALQAEPPDAAVVVPAWGEPAAPHGSDRGAGEQVPLSPREHQILQCLIAGHPNKVIARELDIAEATVKVHIKGLLRKVKASNRTQAAIWAMKQRPAARGNNVVKLPPAMGGASGGLGAESRAAGLSVLARVASPMPVGFATGD